jgi:outer membrane receptor for ferrienterochelin and colicins
VRRFSLYLNQAFLVTLLLTLPAHATDPNAGQASASTPDVAAASGDDLFDLSLKEVLDLEVSTASKLSTSRSKSPGNMMVVTQDQIRRYGYRNVGEALQRVVGFVTNEVGASMTMGYRGLSPLSLNGNPRILVLVDGIRYNEWGADGAILNERFPLDIETVDRIEVLKGAGSATWGTNALFAVVNVISKSGSSERSRQIMYEHGSNDRNKAYFSWGEKTNRGLEYFGSMSVTGEFGDAGAYYPFYDTPPTSNGITREGYNQQGHRGSLKLAYEGLYGHVAYGYNDEHIGSGIDYNFNDGGNSDFFDIPVRSEVGYRGNLDRADKSELVARLFHTYDKYRNAFTYPSFDVPLNNTFSESRGRVQALGTELRLSHQFSDNFQALIGTEITRVFESRFSSALYDVTPDLSSTLLDVDSLDQDVTMNSYFFDLSHTLTESLSLFFGGRLDKFSGLESVFGPRVALVFNPNDENTLRAVFSKGTRNPSLSERIASQSSEEEVKGEQVNYYELFGERRFGERYSISTSLFVSELNDVIAFDTNEEGISRYVNQSGFRSRGIEVEGRAQIDNNLQGYLNSAYAEAVDLTRDMPITLSPKLVSRLGISYGESHDALIISPEIMFVSATRDQAGNLFSSYATGNLTISSYPLGNGLNFSASIYNITDTDYSRINRGFSGEPAFDRAGENGREFRLQAKIDF